MERRLFVITNNTHYLNVRKYIDSHEEAENHVVLLVNPYEGYSDLLEKVNQDKDLKILKEMFSPKKKRSPFHYIDIFKMMSQIKKIGKASGFFDKIFFTNYNSWIQHYFLKQYPDAQRIYISDGTSIYPIAEKRKTDKSIPFSGNQFFLNHILALKPINNLHFFSPLKLDLSKSDSLELFTYSTSKARVNERKVYFIGGPLVELGKLKKSANQHHLENLRKEFSASTIHYFAHRREKEENLRDYSFLDEVIKDHLSFEERLANVEELPSKVVSYVSSVLVNLAPVYPQVEFLYLRLNPADIPAGNEFHSRYVALMNNFERIEEKNLKELILEKKPSYE